MAENDHDLLIRVDTKLDILVSQFGDFKSRVEREQRDMWSAIDELRAKQERGGGFREGLWAFLAAIPGVGALVVAFSGKG